MKRLFLTALAALLVLGLTGCGLRMYPKFDASEYSEIIIRCSETVTEYDITDPEEIAWAVDLLNGCEVASTSERPRTVGWSYCLFFWDKEGEHLYNAEIGPSSITFNNTIFHTDTDYFQPLIDLVDNEGVPMH